MEEKREKNYRLINMEDVQAREVSWLWYPYIPYGKLTIVQGDPGEGKTTFILHLAALLTKGEPLPNEEVDVQREPVNVIYQNAEDSLEDTIKPRLLEAGADCNRVLVIDESVDCLSMTDERLVRAIRETGAKMVVLDPIQAYLGADVDMHRANEIRPVLKQLGNIAEEYGCAIILIGHMNKASSSKSTYRGLGSIDFQATARSVLVVGRIKDDTTLRVIAHDKSSLAPEGTSIAFRMDKEKGFTWEGVYDITVGLVLKPDAIAASQTGTGLVTADAMAVAFKTSVMAKVIIVGGMCGIITSWNSFMIGGSRALYSMAESYMIPRTFAKLHPKHKTPLNALILMGILTMLAPFAGRVMMVWICDAGNFGCCLAYCMVSISFLILRKKEPDMPRPYKVPGYKFVGVMAVLMSGFMVCMYCIPGTGGSLILPEWLMVGAWSLLGVVFFVICKKKYKESFGSLVQLISDEDAATLMPEADDVELDQVIDVAIDHVLARLAG